MFLRYFSIHLLDYTLLRIWRHQILLIGRKCLCLDCCTILFYGTLFKAILTLVECPLPPGIQHRSVKWFWLHCEADETVAKCQSYNLYKAGDTICLNCQGRVRKKIMGGNWRPEELLTFQSLRISSCIISFDSQQFYVLPTQCIYVFCVDLRTNSDYFPIQH